MATDTMPRIFMLMAAAVGGSDRLLRIPVAMVARGYKGKLRFAVTPDDLAQIVRNFRKRGTGDLVIDYDHSIEFAAGAGEPVPAAGWLKKIDDGPDANGVLWGLAEFTERAAKMLAAREYRYFSPVIVWGARDKDTGQQQGTTLTSIALTNSPLMEKLPALAFSDAGWEIHCGDAVKEDSVTLTVESAQAELKALRQRVFAEIGKLMDQGLDHTDAVIKAYEDNPDFGKRERQLLDFLKMAKKQYAITGDATLTASERESAIRRIEAELDAKTRARMASAGLLYHDALKLIAAENPHLDRQRTKLLTGRGTTQSERESALVQIDAELDLRTRARMSGTALQYHQALKLVAAENPDLDQRRTRLIRGEREQ